MSYSKTKAPTPVTAAYLDVEHSNIQRAFQFLTGRIPAFAAADLPAWSAGRIGYVAWDSTNDRLVIYGTSNRKYFSASGTF